MSILDGFCQTCYDALGELIATDKRCRKCELDICACCEGEHVCDEYSDVWLAHSDTQAILAEWDNPPDGRVVPSRGYLCPCRRCRQHPKYQAMRRLYMLWTSAPLRA